MTSPSQTELYEQVAPDPANEIYRREQKSLRAVFTTMTFTLIGIFTLAWMVVTGISLYYVYLSVVSNQGEMALSLIKIIVILSFLWFVVCATLGSIVYVLLRYKSGHITESGAHLEGEKIVDYDPALGRMSTAAFPSGEEETPAKMGHLPGKPDR